MATEPRRVVVSTQHRGVFFGTFLAQNDSEVMLTDARMCVYWSAETKGFIGLAATGPLGNSRVTPACPRLTLTDVTAIVDCTPEAIERWEAGPWS